MNPGIKKYGKSSKELLAIKQVFFEQNDQLLKSQNKTAKLYREQPLRTTCKCCDQHTLTFAFRKLGVDFYICDTCTHLNGANDDTDEFCASVYTEDNGADYAKAYSTADKDAYRERVSNIDRPKADFMLNALKEYGEETFSGVSDFGAGSGYFVAALIDAGVQGVTGYEVSRTQVELGNSMIGADVLIPHDLSAIYDLAGSIRTPIVSLIGVLEHLQNPRQLLDNLKQNINVKYLYISVPLFSPSVMFELVFPEVMQRHLSGGHTHLYTQKSLAWMSAEFHLEPIAEWLFGTDVLDLYRNVMVKLLKDNNTRKMADKWSEMWLGVVDDLQMVLDRKELSSEVHVLYKFQEN